MDNPGHRVRRMKAGLPEMLEPHHSKKAFSHILNSGPVNWSPQSLVWENRRVNNAPSSLAGEERSRQLVLGIRQVSKFGAFNFLDK